MPSILCRILQMNFLYVHLEGMAQSESGVRRKHKNIDVLSFMSDDAA